MHNFWTRGAKLVSILRSYYYLMNRFCNLLVIGSGRMTWPPNHFLSQLPSIKPDCSCSSGNNKQNKTEAMFYYFPIASMSTIIFFKRRIWNWGIYLDKDESQKFEKKNMKTCCTHWVFTIIAQKFIRVGEKCHFLSDSKKHEFSSSKVY